jgi:hypothetical protein
MMHSIHTDDDSSDTSSNGLFSPVRGRRTSLHHSSTPEQDSLPRLQDTSWIGARVSPIPSLDEDEEANDLVTAPYRKALKTNLVVGERSSLLGQQGSSTLHPLWGGGPSHPRQHQQQTKSRKSKKSSPFASLVVGISGIYLGCIALHDAYLWYLSYRRGVEPKYPLAWYLPWLSPSARILMRFGAFSPARFAEGQYWRPITSLAMSTSVAEWLLMIWAWWWELRRIHNHSGSQHVWLYLISAATGQLWMAAFHSNGISGCASWGTCGVLCAMGVSRPDRRFVLFLTAIALVIINLLQPTSSSFGAIGASFFGWSLYGVGLPPAVTLLEDNGGGKCKRQPWGCLNWLAAVVVVKLWLIPIFFILWNRRRATQD